MAEAVVSFAVKRLGDLLIKEAIFLHGVTGKVEEIQVELRRMKCFLKDADARQDEDETIRNWVTEIRENALDAEDTIETFVLKVAMRKRRGLWNKFKRYACIFSELIALHKVGTDIDAIKNRISSLTTSLQSYNIKSSGSIEGGGGEYCSSISSGRIYDQNRQRLPRRSYSHVVDEDTVGVEGNVQILVDQLLVESESSSRRSSSSSSVVVAIWGLGGLGKTTLAKKVYHHGEVRRHFECFAWSSVSQQFNLRALIQEILIKLMSPISPQQRKEIEKMSDGEVVKMVYHIQEEKKCLVILDDVWSTDAWDMLKSAFPLHLQKATRRGRSKIVITTRNKGVASHADPRAFLFQPKYLTNEQSWELLQRRAFFFTINNPNAATDPTINNMEEMGKDMIRCCGGLPLAVVALGGLLAKNHTLHDWERIHRNIKSYLMRARGKDNCKQQDSGVWDVLALSYQDLSYHLKYCFLYLGHFPEDYEIPTKSLVRMWVAEGIVSEEDDGERYLAELIERCMVQVGRTDSNGRLKTCHMHDLMRDLCLLKAREENFLEIVDATFQQVETSSRASLTRATEKVRRRAIYLDDQSPPNNKKNNEDGDDDIYVKVLKPENGTPLRSLLMFYPPKEETVHWILRKLELNKFALLRVLSLEWLSLGEKLPRAIGNLVRLKFLSLRGATLLRFPSSSIRNLGCIQTLDLRFTPSSYESMISFRINKVLGRMKWLRHLYLPDYLNVCKNKVRWEKLSNLETLKGFDAAQWDVKDLAHLTKLQKLKVKKVKSFRELLEVILISSNNIRSLAVYNIDTKVEETDLKQLSKCQRLCKLYLKGEISNLPENDNLFPPNLTKLSLQFSKLKQDPTPILERLPNLTILELYESYNGEEMVFSANGFPRLKVLELACRLVKRLRVDKGAMPNLNELTIALCDSLEMVPEGVRYITTLQTLVILDMSKDFIQRLQGEDFYKVRHVPSLTLIDDDGETGSIRP